jgi:Cu+-exporting ATPase
MSELPGPASEFEIAGMTCQSCARRATDALHTVAGVALASVDLAAGRARIRWDPTATPDAAAVIAAVRSAGFQATPLTAGTAPTVGSSWSPLRGWRLNVVLGLAASVPLALGEWAFDWVSRPWFAWVGLALALPVQAVAGARFYRGAWTQLRVRSANMDTLVALGSTTAFGYSAWCLLAGWPTHVYFLESSAILTLISLGH